MSLGISIAIFMAICSQLWSVLATSIPSQYQWTINSLRIVANAASGLVIGLLICRLHRASTTDPLTHVYNRQYFLPRLEKHLALAKRHNVPLSLVLIDLDHFKECNDTFGHLYGDRLLGQVAMHLRSMVRSTDTVARYGGDEFLILLPHTGSSGAVHLMERIRNNLLTQTEYGPDSTFSAGIATYPADGDTAELLLQRADQALYAAKNKRNNVQPYSECSSLSAPSC